MRPFIPASVWGDLGMRYHGNLSGLSSICTRYRILCSKSSQLLFSFGISFYYNMLPLYSANDNKYNRLPLLIKDVLCSC